MEQTRHIGIIGARALPEEYKAKVKAITKYLLGKGYGIASGGAAGADAYALQSLLELGAAKKSIIFSAWQNLFQFPAATKEQVKEFLAQGGKIIWGDVGPYAHRNSIVAGLLGRNIRLASSVSGIVAFLYGDSRGTIFTIKQAAQRNIPVVVFRCDKQERLPSIEDGYWKALNTSDCWNNGFKIKVSFCPAP